MTEEEYERAKQGFESDPAVKELSETVKAIAKAEAPQRDENLSDVIAVLDRYPFQNWLVALHVMHGYISETDDPSTWNISKVVTLIRRLRERIDGADRGRELLAMANRSRKQDASETRLGYVRSVLLHAKEVLPYHRRIEISALLADMPESMTLDEEVRWCVRVVEMLEKDATDAAAAPQSTMPVPTIEPTGQQIPLPTGGIAFGSGGILTVKDAAKLREVGTSNIIRRRGEFPCRGESTVKMEIDKLGFLEWNAKNPKKTERSERPAIASPEQVNAKVRYECPKGHGVDVGEEKCPKCGLAPTYVRKKKQV
jgi:hypothetical protein